MRKAPAGFGRGVPEAAASLQTAKLAFVVPRELWAGSGAAKPWNLLTSIRRMRKAKKAYFQSTLAGERTPSLKKEIECPKSS